MPVIGFLRVASPGPFAHLVAAFRQGLQEGVYIDGQNVTIEYRWAEFNMPAPTEQVGMSKQKLDRILSGDLGPPGKLASFAGYVAGAHENFDTAPPLTQRSHRVCTGPKPPILFWFSNCRLPPPLGSRY